MPIRLTKTVNFGGNKGSLSTVGYRIIDSVGATSGSRITAGVGEVLAGSGIYSGSLYVTNSFSGSVLWDTGEATPTYASEDYNGLEEHIDFTRHITAGRWQIDKDAFEMIFYREDNETEIARYALKDRDGDPSFTEVFDRIKE